MGARQSREMNSWLIAGTLLLISCVSGAPVSHTPEDAPVKVVEYTGQNGGNRSLSIAAGAPFLLQIPNFASTGFLWYFDSIEPSSVATQTGNATGGGVTGPPYINFTFTAEKAGQALVTIEHAKSWERDDPTAMKGHAFLHLTVHA